MRRYCLYSVHRGSQAFNIAVEKVVTKSLAKIHRLEPLARSARVGW